jgi:hypothetical protein
VVIEQFSCPLQTVGVEDKNRYIRRLRTLKIRKKVKKLEPGFPVLWKAVLAIDRSSLGRLKWYFAIFTAV